MNDQSIQTAIKILQLALKVEYGSFIKKDLVETVAKMFVNEKEKVVVNKLTSVEISTGINEGKLSCVKMVKDRLGMNLMDAKRFSESEFEKLGYNFKGY